MLHRRELYGHEVAYLASPRRIDSDGDGLPDYWEIAHGLDPQDPSDGSNQFAETQFTFSEAFRQGVQANVNASPENRDGDGLDNDDDADPEDGAIDWEPTPAVRYAMLKLDGWDYSTHGHPVMLTNKGEVKFERAYWDDDTWHLLSVPPLQGIISLDYTERSYPGGPLVPVDSAFVSPRGGMSDNLEIVTHGAKHFFEAHTADDGDISLFWAQPDVSVNPQILGIPPNSEIPVAIYSNSYINYLDIARNGIINEVTDILLASDYVKIVRFDAANPFQQIADHLIQDVSFQAVTSDYFGNLAALVEPEPGSDLRVWAWPAGETAGFIASTDVVFHESDPFDPEAATHLSTPGDAPGDRSVLNIDGNAVIRAADGKWHAAESLNGIALMSPSGTAVLDSSARNPRIRVNGQTLRLRDLCSALDEPLISRIDMIDINEGGSILLRIVENGVSKPAILLPVDIVPDWNRDGKIDSADRGKITGEKPFRWWINDDNDLATAERGENTQDIPKQSTSERDCNDLLADGMRDQIDFFPLHLDLKSALEILPESDYKYVIKHEEEALKFHEYQACVIDGSDTGHFPNRHVKVVGAGRGLATKELKLASTQGAELSASMLNKAKEGNGVIVIEGAKKTEKPLVLEIIKKSDNSSVVEIEFPIRIVDVEDMYRHVNMRDVMGGSGGHATQIDEPSGYPDDLTNGKYVAYVHGYNVSGESARGSQSNIFKRLHHLGSRARFIGISWLGNPPSPINLDALPDYHRAASNGLTTGIVAKARLGFTQNSDLTILAHSLGNTLVGSALAYHGLKVDHYYIINGAIPLQAYDSAQTSNSSGDPDMKRNMTEDDWKPYYDHGNNGFQHRLFAANWHELFDPTDNRSKLTWKDIFAKPELLSVAYNFYSPSDEIVENPDESEEVTHPSNIDAALFGGGRHAWVQQEIAKGGQSIISGPSFHDINGGWEFNYNPPFGVGGSSGGIGYYKNYFFNGSELYRKYTPEEAANEISDADLRTKPFHQKFLFPDLYDPAQGSVTAGVTTNIYKLLGTGIPAMSYAIAANALEPFEPSIGGGLSKNFNMPQELRSPGGYSSWPADENANNPEDWMHSDFKDVAFQFLNPMYQKMIDLAELDEE